MPWLPKPSKPPEKVERLTTTQRGYGWQHQCLRADLLQTFPVCQLRSKGCQGWSTEAHHLRYGEDLTAEDYLAVCHTCHQKLESDKAMNADSQVQNDS